MSANFEDSYPYYVFLGGLFPMLFVAFKPFAAVSDTSFTGSPQFYVCLCMISKKLSVVLDLTNGCVKISV